MDFREEHDKSIISNLPKGLPGNWTYAGFIAGAFALTIIATIALNKPNLESKVKENNSAAICTHDNSIGNYDIQNKVNKYLILDYQ